jgi:site-specific DNA-methyltransferase (adenine-specific)
VKLSNIKPNPQNPRLIKDERFKKLVQSIKDFPEMMAKRPMVCVTDVDGKLFPLGGNMRLKALKEAGYTDIPDEWVTMADEWTQEQRNEFIIKDNISFGEHDWDALKDWDTEQLEDWGLDVPSFEPDQVLEAVEDDFDATPPEEAITVLGDIYEIGEHRLLCGDSTDSEQVAKLMNGQKADIVFTDPPYRQEGHIEAAESEAKQQRGIERNSTKEISPSLVKHAKKLKGLLDFEPKEFVNTLFSFNPNCVYIFCNKSLVKEYLNYFEGYNYTILVWKKPTVSPFYVADYLADIEYLLYFNKAGKKWNNKNDFSNYSRVLEAKQEKGEHPTIKPISIIQPAIQNNSDINDLVLDYFGGSGSTMVASHQLKRKCYVMELDPKYCDVIVKRMVKLDPTLTVKRNGIECKSDFEQNSVRTA